MDYIPRDRQLMMFSATIPATIEKLGESMMKDPIFISIGPSGLTNQSVNQIIMWVEDISKRKKLFIHAILYQMHSLKMFNNQIIYLMKLTHGTASLLP